MSPCPYDHTFEVVVGVLVEGDGNTRLTNSVKRVLLVCSKGVTRVLQGCCEVVLRML
jgi:hypothetical protein